MGQIDTIEQSEQQIWTTFNNKDNIGQNWTIWTNLDKWTKFEKIEKLGHMDNYGQLWKKENKTENTGQTKKVSFLLKS